jgi:RNA polymerase sigma-54 factor
LRSVIQEELQANPTLEELPMDGESVDKPTEAEGTDADNAGSSESDESNASAPEESPAREEMDFTKQFEILGKLDEDWRDHMANAGGAQSYSAEDAEKRQHFFDSLVSETSLQEHLMQQVVLDDLAPPVLEALKQLIGNLDDRGFLAQTPSDVALQTGLPYDTVLEALKLLQSFDPPGIGSQTLPECLLAQLRAKGRGDTLAARMLRDQFELLSRRRIPELARKLGAAPDDIQAAIEEIGKLDPAPGRRFAEDNNRVVVPDVVVEKDGEEWKIHLNSDYIPRLRLSSTYRELIAKGTLSKEERD